MRALLRTWPCRVASSVTALALLCTSVLAYPAAAAAASAGSDLPIPTRGVEVSDEAAAPVTDEATPERATPASETSPTIVGEVIERRTETSKHYRLSNGMFRAEIHGQPIHYKDSKGKWADIDPRVVARGLDEYASERAAFRTEFASGILSDGSVTFGKDKWAVKITAPGMTRAVKASTDDKVTYLGVGDDVSYEYRVLDNGLKETVLLHSPSAPATIDVELKLTGVTLRKGFDGTWAFYAPDSTTPVAAISDFSVFDSSADASGQPAVCQDARMEIEPTAKGSKVTYSVPQAWLNDAARVFPVRIDPLYGSWGADSYVWSGSPGSCYSSSSTPYQRTGYYPSGGTSSMCRSFMWFDVSSLASKYIRSANLHTYCIEPYGLPTQLWKMTDKSGVGCSWYTQPQWGEQIASETQWVTGYRVWPVTSAVQSWTGGGDVEAASNCGFRMNVEEDKAYLQRWASVRDANPDIRPALFADYFDPAPPNGLQTLAGSTSGADVPADGAHEVTATVRVLSTAGADIKYVRMIVNVGKYFENECDDSYLRGHMVWYANEPNLPADHKWPLANGAYGWMTFIPTDGTYNNETIRALLSRCTATPVSIGGNVGYDLTFVFCPNPDFGDEQGNSTGFQVAYGPGGATTWASQWYYPLGASFDVLPAPAAASAAASLTLSTGWHTETDANNDGLVDNPENAGTAGRGAVDLTWPAVDGAVGYRVLMSDGNAWRQVADLAGQGSTTWTSKGKGLFPTDSNIPVLHQGQNPFVGGGLELRDDPTLLYRTVAVSGGVLASDSFDRANSSSLGWGWTVLKDNRGTGTCSIENNKLKFTQPTASLAAAWAMKNQFAEFGRPPVAGGWTDQSVAYKVETGDANVNSRGIALRWDGTTKSSAYGDPSNLYLGFMGSGYFSIYKRTGTAGTWTLLNYVTCPLATGDTVTFSAVGTTLTLKKNGTTVVTATDGTFTSGYPGYRMEAVASGGMVVRVDDFRLTQPEGTLLAGNLDSFPGYQFKVVPYNSHGAAHLDDCPVRSVQVPKRTKYVNEPRADAKADLGIMAGHAAAAVLDDAVGDRSRLELSATDLQAGSWGPEAKVSRTYRSDLTAPTMFASGWRFNFEQKIASDATGAMWTDETGSATRFAKVSGAYRAPKSTIATLSYDALLPNPWLLELKGGTRLRFDSQGRIATETDRDEQSTTYTWTTSNLTIRAANGQSITLALSAGKVVDATYLSRHVHYDAGGAVITVNPSKPEQCTTDYSYDASNRLTELKVIEKPDAVWGFDYSGVSRVYRVRYPGYASDNYRRADFPLWTGDSATVMRFGEVEGVAGTSVYTTYRWSEAGALVQRSIPGTSAVWACEYNAVGAQLFERSPLGRVNSAMTDLRGNVVSSTDEGGRVTTTLFDGNDDPVAETDQRGATTYRTYASGRLTVEEKTLDAAGRRSRTEFTYGDSRGFLTSKRSKIATDTWAKTDYAGFALCGKPTTTIERGVKLTGSGAPTDLTTSASYDSYGTLTSETNALAKQVTAVTPDLVGRAKQSRDAAGVITNFEYDCLDSVKKTWKSHDTTTTKLDWWEATYDGESRVLVETVKDRDGNGVSTTTHTYDPMGREVASDNSAIAGVNTTRYDAAGNATTSWVEGADKTRANTSTRTATNADGQAASELQPGADTWSDETAYNLDGTVAWEKNADGTVVANTYSASGDLASESTASDQGPATTSYATDLDGQTVSQTDPDRSVISYTYDLMGRLVSSGIGGQAVTSKTYNTLGWVLAETEFDGVNKSREYDKAGRETKETIGGNTTTRTFDDMGNEKIRTNPDTSVLTTNRDCFGRVWQEKHTGTNGTTVRDLNTFYDAAGRVARTEEKVSNLVRTFAYAPTGAVTVTETRQGRTITTGIHSTGLLTSITANVAGKSVDWSVTETDTAGRVTDATSTAFPIDWSIRYDQVGRPIRAGAAPTGGTGDIGAQCIPPYPSGENTPGVTYSYSPTTGKKTNDRFKFALLPSDETTYTYDVTGRLLSALANNQPTNYAYSASSGALAAYRRPGEATTTLSYTSAGRLDQVASPSGTRKYTHNTTTGQRTFAGPTASPNETAYTWTGERLKKVTYPGGVSEFTYDASGQRTKSVVTSGGITTTTTWLYDGLRLLGYSATRSDTATYTLDYLYDEKGVLFAGVYAGTGTSAVPFVIVTTDRGDVRELVDQSGRAFAHYRYDPYGRPAAPIVAGTSRVPTATATAIASRQVLRYASYCYDEATSLYYCSQRYYDPQTAAFISRDPARADGEESAYQYCGGDPVGKVDPSGEVWMTVRTTGWQRLKGGIGVLYGARHFKRTQYRAWFTKVGGPAAPTRSSPYVWVSGKRYKWGPNATKERTYEMYRDEICIRTGIKRRYWVFKSESDWVLRREVNINSGRLRV